MSDDARYAALVARDARFDGVFFVGVRTTGVYCRPICTARTPKRASCEFFERAALAEKSGYRACFRCRPELAPGNAEVDAVDALVERATARIAEGALDAMSVDALAATLGVSGRQLRRATEARIGVSPVELAQTHRLAIAKQLIHDTELSITEVAFAAGFGSVRRFNALFAERMGIAPIELRRNLRARRAATLTLRLDYRAPYDVATVMQFLAARAIPGIEVVDGATYRRTLMIDDTRGSIEVSFDPGSSSGLAARSSDGTRATRSLRLAIEGNLRVMPVVARVRRLFDLDARPDAIDALLSRDPLLAPRVARHPGLRVPGAIDPFEASVRALLGQQVSVAGATTLAGRFADRFGTRIDGHRYFPTANAIARVPADRIATIGLPGKRAEAIRSIAQAISDGRLRFDGKDLEAFVASAIALPGVGPWTAQYLAMRAVHLPDAFPDGDLGIAKVLGTDTRRADTWRPFRAYAVMHLWYGGESNVDRANDAVAARRPAAASQRRATLRVVSTRAKRTAGLTRNRPRARSRDRAAS